MLGGLAMLDWLHTHKHSHTKQNSWWLKDAKGIEVSRVCDECIEAVKDQYDPAIFGDHRPDFDDTGLNTTRSYEDIVEEQIEED
jgi:hypothetical protein